MQILINDDEWLQVDYNKNWVLVTLIKYDHDLEFIQEDDTSDVWPYECHDLLFFEDSANMQKILKEDMSLEDFKKLLKKLYAIDLDEYL